MKNHRIGSKLITALVCAFALFSIACASSPKTEAKPQAAAPAEKAPAAPAEKAPAAPAEKAPAAPAPEKPHGTVSIPEAMQSSINQPTEGAWNPMAGDPLASPWLDYKPQPPDGVWLVDLEGREYFVVAVPKQEGYYTRTGPNRIRLKHGIPLSVEREDESTFFVKIFRADADAEFGPIATTGVSDKVTDEEKETIAKKYEVSTPSSNELSFSAIGEGLPKQGQWRNGFALADVDGDGALDLVHGPPRRSMGGKPVIFRGDGKGGFTRWNEVTFPDYPYDYGDAAAGDFNKDGKVDLAFGIHLRGIVAMLGDGKGHFTPFSEGLELSNPAVSTYSANPFTSRALEVLDWNRDGRDDLLALSEGPARIGGGKSSAYAPGKRIYLAGKSGWTRAEGSKVADPTIGDTIALGDLNADGKKDFITGMSQPGNKSIINKAGAGTTWEVSTLESLRKGAIVHGVAIADLNGDRRGDVLVSWLNVDGTVPRVGIDVMLSQPGGWKAVGLWGRAGRDGIRSIAVGDLDGDGKKDVVGFEDNSQPVILKGLGNGKFTQETPDGIDLKLDDCAGYAVALADIDRDGRDEIVAGFAGERCSTQGSLRAWKARPAATN